MIPKRLSLGVEAVSDLESANNDFGRAEDEGALCSAFSFVDAETGAEMACASLEPLPALACESWRFTSSHQEGSVVC